MQVVVGFGGREGDEDVVFGWEVVGFCEEALVDLGDVPILVVPKLPSGLSYEPHLLIEVVGLGSDLNHWLLLISLCIKLIQHRNIRDPDIILAKPVECLIDWDSLVPYPLSLVILVHF